MVDFLKAIGDWAQSNWEALSALGGFAFIGSALSYYFIKHFLPKLQNLLLSYLVKVVSKMFGVPVEDVSDVVQELPIVAKMNAWQEQLKTQNELKLIEYKNKLVSPKLSEAERAAYQGMYDNIMNGLGDTISFATVKVLDEIEKKAKEALKV